MRMGSILMCVVIATGFTPVAAQSERLNIDVFTTMDRPFVNMSAARYCCTLRQHRLDALDELTRDISRSLSSNPAVAEQQALRAFEIRRSEIEQAVRIQTNVMKRALEYRLDRFPAIVFDDGESVIYGVTDLREALAIYNASEAGQ